MALEAIIAALEAGRKNVAEAERAQVGTQRKRAAQGGGVEGVADAGKQKEGRDKPFPISLDVYRLGKNEASIKAVYWGTSGIL
jgi:hypothetical protein